MALTFHLLSFALPTMEGKIAKYLMSGLPSSSSGPVIQFWPCCSVAKSCPTLCDPMDCSMPGFPVLHWQWDVIRSLVGGFWGSFGFLDKRDWTNPDTSSRMECICVAWSWAAILWRDTLKGKAQKISKTQGLTLHSSYMRKKKKTKKHYLFKLWWLSFLWFANETLLTDVGKFQMPGPNIAAKSPLALEWKHNQTANVKWTLCESSTEVVGIVEITKVASSEQRGVD